MGIKTMVCLYLGLFCQPTEVLNTPVISDPPVILEKPATKVTVTEYVPATAWEFRELLLKHLPDEDKQYISALGGQWWQEARWRCDLSSKYADGCCQFTPDTAKWMSSLDCKDLGDPDPFDPQWAYPCGVKYMMWLKRALIKHCMKNYGDVPSGRDLWGMVLKAYNGGIGWVYREMEEAKRQGLDPLSLTDLISVCVRGAKFDVENDEYPIKILDKWMPKYLAAGYGGTDLR